MSVALLSMQGMIHVLYFKSSEVIFCVKNRLRFKSLFTVISNMLHRDVAFELTVHD